MITDLQVENFQALGDARIRLDWFTVITGPTGSGKSALLRAMRLCAFNARGTSFVRHGTKVAKVALGSQDENWVAAIHRGTRGSDKYVLTWREGDGPQGRNGAEFTKLEGKVPPEISGHMDLSEVNFAGQFDRPYLLTDSGSQVARVLGELTNVTLVFDAAREANRRKLETARALKAAELELADLKRQGRSFGNLKDRLAQATLAQEILDSMKETEADRDRLAFLYSEWQQALSLSAAAAQRLALTAPPSVSELDSALEQWKRLGSLLADLGTASRWKATAEREARAASEAEQELEQQLHGLLADAGTCPTCGQAVSAA